MAEQPFIFAQMEFERVASMDDEPVQFSVNALNGAFIERAISPAIDEIEEHIEASELGDKCDLPLTDDRRDALRSAYTSGQRRIYAVRKSGMREGDSLFWVLTIPNAMDYATIDDVRDDFDICAAGAWSVFKITNRTLVFVHGCGGASDEGEACDAAEHAVKTSLIVR